MSNKNGTKWRSSSANMIFEKIDYFRDALMRETEFIEGAIYKVTPRTRGDSDLRRHFGNTELTFKGFTGKNNELLLFYDNLYKNHVTFHIMDFKGSAPDGGNSYQYYYDIKLIHVPGEGIKREAI